MGSILAVDPSRWGVYWVLLGGSGPLSWGYWSPSDPLPPADLVALELPLGTPVRTGDGGLALLATALWAGFVGGHYLSQGVGVMWTTPHEWRRGLLGKATEASPRRLREVLSQHLSLPPRGSGFTPHHLDATAVGWWVSQGRGHPWPPS